MAVRRGDDTWVGPRSLSFAHRALEDATHSIAAGAGAGWGTDSEGESENSDGDGMGIGIGMGGHGRGTRGKASGGGRNGSGKTSTRHHAGTVSDSAAVDEAARDRRHQARGLGVRGAVALRTSNAQHGARSGTDDESGGSGDEDEDRNGNAMIYGGAGRVGASLKENEVHPRQRRRSARASAGSNVLMEPPGLLAMRARAGIGRAEAERPVAAGSDGE